jgi:calcineurin-like phosphoesterase family protein
MKVYYTGDCHFDFDKTNTSFQNFINQVNQIKPGDLLVIFGDIHNNHGERIKILRTIDNKIKCKCIFVIGNHDFWNLVEPITNFTLMNQSIQFVDEIEKLRKEKFENIIIVDNEIKNISGVKIMGSSGY